MKEVDLYQPAKRWLEDRGYIVYPEVECWGSRADIVGIRENHSVIIELKTALSLDLIGQAVRWVERKSADQVWVGVPYPQGDVHWYAEHLLRQEGIGLLLINLRWKDGVCNDRLAPRNLTKTNVDRYDISKSVTSYHLETGIEGGHAGGGCITPYRITMIEVQKFLSEVKKGEWTLMKDIMSNVKTHYRGENPGQSLGNALESFERDWCEVKVINRRKHFRSRGVKK